MTTTTPRRSAKRRSWIPYTVTGFVAVAILGGGIAVAASGGSAPSGGPVRTGELSSMGMPVIETPGTASGTVTAAGLTAEPAAWAMGVVPLNVAVRPTWTLHNTGTDAITLGEPHAEVIEGCCPGVFSLPDGNVLAAGGKTRLSFELSMHPGMDGRHDMAIHVPVERADGTSDTLTVTVTGDFHD